MVFFVCGVVGAFGGLIVAGLWCATTLILGLPLPTTGQVQGLALGGACLGEIVAAAMLFFDP